MRNITLKFYCFSILFILFSYYCEAQLANFNLSVTKTNETCTGNGSLTFNVTNTTVGSNIVYSLYLLPNITSPVAVLNNSSITGLSAGNYLVNALQSFNGNSNFQQQNVQILDLRAPLVYNVTSVNASCYVLGKITVNVTQGNAIDYEIISGPQVRPIQTSNIFIDLPIGEYTVKVTDACGDAVVQVHSILLTPTENFNLTLLTDYCLFLNCNFRTVSFAISSYQNQTIDYPLNVQFIIYPPNGATPIIINQIVTSGNSTSHIESGSIPYYNSNYTFDINVTSFCGEIHHISGDQSLFIPSIKLGKQDRSNCLKEIHIYEICNLLPPYTVTFVSSPNGFNASSYNNNNLGPFTTFPINYVSTVSNQIPNGNYVIKIIDSCGNTAQGTVSVSMSTTDYSLISVPCESNQFLNIPGFGVPIETITIVNAPSSLGLTLPLNATSSIVNNNYSSILVPGNYQYTGINVCGEAYIIDVIIPNLDLYLTIEAKNLTGCSGSYGSLSISGSNSLSSIIITAAPVGFPHQLPYNVSNLIEYGELKLLNIPAGNYTFTITDICGIVKIESVLVPTIISNASLNLYEHEGCGLYDDSIALISPNGSLTEMIITAAPPNFLYPLPYNVSFNIASNGVFCMNSLPVGNYTFESKDECNVLRSENKVLTGFQATNLIEIQPNCGSFNISLYYSNNNTELQTFWLQKFNPITNQWVHPITEISYTTGQILNTINSYQLNNLSVNYNITTTGIFRILIDYKIFDNGIYQTISCVDTVKNFEFTGILNINSQYSLTCNSGQTDIVLVANGVAPYTFEITTKNGLPFYVNNGSLNVFTGLQQGIYNFKIVDACGNILNKLIDLNTLIEPQITPENLCEGQIGKLSVPNIPILNYQWWKNNASSTILSTTSSLIFNPYTSASAGTYYVRFYSTSPLSCIDKTISFIVNPLIIPNAGQDGILNICASTGIINLNTLINGNYDTNGTWVEISNSGNLVGNNWNSSASGLGQYIFKYRVTGNCNSIDESIVTINYYNAPPTPTITGVLELCEGEILTLNSNAIANVSYLWSGPNNFSSTNQNLILNSVTQLNSGIYTLKITLNGCEATNNVDVIINKNPSYTLLAGCLGSDYTISVVPDENSFTLNSVSYLWSGPNGFSSTLNPIIITNQSVGNYSVLINNSSNCSKNEQIFVNSTVCEIPNTITPNNDGNNDSFNLTGLKVENIKIYSRWGKLVFSKSNYLSEFHGQNDKDESLPDATYFYVINLQNGDSKTGWILVVN